MTETFDALSDEQVADEIATWAGRVAAGEARLMALIAEYDRRNGWATLGFLSLAHWLSCRLGWAPRAAQERARTARALSTLPDISAAMCRGELSYSQVRAMTRVATPEDEQTWIDLARVMTGAQLERTVRGVRRARKPAEDKTDPGYAGWKMRSTVRYDDDGTMSVTVKLPAEQGAILLAAIDAAREEIDRERSAAQDEDADADADAERSAERDGAQDDGAERSAERSSPQERRPLGDQDSDPTVRASIAEGMVRIAQTALATTIKGKPDAARRARQRLTAQVDPISGWARSADGEILPPNAAPTLDELKTHVRPLIAADLTKFDLGRSSRTLSDPLRALLGQLDGERCRFPGCTRTHRLHGHHVEYWSAGGPTDLANLVLVCSRHHTLIHQLDFQLTLHPDRTLTVKTADGVPVIQHTAPPAQSAAALDPAGIITATTLPPMVTGDRLDLHYVVAVLMQHAA